MTTLAALVRAVVRFLVVWAIDMISLLLTAAIVPDISLYGVDSGTILVVAAAASLVLGVVNLFVRPIILLFSLPFGSFAVLAVGLVVNAAALLITGWLLPVFEVGNVFAAFIGGLVFAAINTVATNALTVSEADSFYQKLVERLARRSPFPNPDDGKRGLVMLEIDGLSYWHIQRAIDDGYMPTLSRMLDAGYALSRVDCGLPSQTSACQSGIMFGDNVDIPAFRWYDKDEQRLYVSGRDAAVINARYAQGKGLMRKGSSINNMMNGDAAKSLLTLSHLNSGSDVEKKQRADDLYLLMLNPYFFMRVLVLYLVDVGRELWQAWQQRRKDVRPRLNRTAHFYPFVRAATTVLMREVAAYLATLDIIRGSPSIYVTWPGYDEVAHHSGPWTTDAFKTLRQFDEVIAHIRRVIREKAGRSYALVILSDHGQSFGATFRQRYGMDLKQVIEQYLPSGTHISHTSGGDDGTLSVAAMGEELGNIDQQKAGSAVGRAVAKQGQKLATRSVVAGDQEAEQIAESQVIVCGSGNLAQVYFDLQPHKLTRKELDAAYPGMVDGLVNHEGVGFVVCYDGGVPLLLGKKGERNLHTGAVQGQDPLMPYARDGVATVDLRAAQVRRVADFPHAGDLIVNSTLFADGTVAAMEELIGNHGGLGGEQTDAFLFHPFEKEVPPTTNSIDFFHILNGWRDLPPSAEPFIPQPRSADEGWSIHGLWQGLRAAPRWLMLAGRSLLLDRDAFREIAADPYMSGPALLIAVCMTALVMTLDLNTFSPISIVWRYVAWFLSVLMVYFTARILRGSRDFSRMVRAMGFAQIANLLALLDLIPSFTPIAAVVTTLLVFLTTWLGAAEAGKLTGWRSLLLPFVNMVVTTVALIVLGVLVAGADLTAESLAAWLGLQRQ